MDMKRRDFLKAGGGLVFCLTVGLPTEEAGAQTAAQTAKTINAWVRISPDGTVTIYSAGAEMGQGSMTSLPLILAEEMDADWDKVKIEFAPADSRLYGYMFNNAQMMSIVGSRA